MKLAAAQPAKQRVLLRDQVNQPAVKNKNVELAVVVEVVYARAPTRVLRIRLRDAVGCANVLKTHLSRVVQQPVVAPVSHPKIKQSSAFEIGKDRPHRRSGLAILSVGRVRIAANLFKGSIMLVVKEKVLRAVVGDINVVPPIVIEIRSRHTHRSAHISANARLVGYVRERAVAVVVEELVGLALVIQRSRIIGRRIKCAIGWIELDVTAHEQIDATVLVVIQPGRTDRPAVHIDAGLLGHVGKVPIAVVVIENRFAVSGDQQIDKAVVVIVGCRYGHSIYVRVESGALCHVGKCSVAVVAVEMIVWQRIWLDLERKRMHRIVQRPSVQHIERLQTGVVVVEPNASCASIFEQ